MPVGTGIVRDNGDPGMGSEERGFMVGYIEVTDYPNANVVGKWKPYKRVGLGSDLTENDEVGFNLQMQTHGNCSFHIATITSVN